MHLDVPAWVPKVDDRPLAKPSDAGRACALSHRPVAHHPRIAQRKRRLELLGVLLQSVVAHIHLPEPSDSGSSPIRFRETPNPSNQGTLACEALARRDLHRAGMLHGGMIVLPEAVHCKHGS